MALLTSCLTLVKPVGMSAHDTAAWLAVASDELAHIPEDLLTDACATARRTCTHHGQIVPTILKDAEPRLAQRHRIAAPDPTDAPQLTQERWHPTREQLEEIKAATARIRTNLARDQ